MIMTPTIYVKECLNQDMILKYPPISIYRRLDIRNFRWTTTLFRTLSNSKEDLNKNYSISSTVQKFQNKITRETEHERKQTGLSKTL